MKARTIENHCDRLDQTGHCPNRTATALSERLFRNPLLGLKDLATLRTLVNVSRHRLSSWFDYRLLLKFAAPERREIVQNFATIHIQKNGNMGAGIGFEPMTSGL